MGDEESHEIPSSEPGIFPAPNFIPSLYKRMGGGGHDVGGKRDPVPDPRPREIVNLQLPEVKCARICDLLCGCSGRLACMRVHGVWGLPRGQGLYPSNLSSTFLSIFNPVNRPFVMHKAPNHREFHKKSHMGRLERTEIRPFINPWSLSANLRRDFWGRRVAAGMQGGDAPGFFSVCSGELGQMCLFVKGGSHLP